MATVVRPSWPIRTMCAVPVIVLGLGLLFAAFDDSSQTSWVRVMEVFGGLLAVVLGLRSWRLAVVLNEEGVRVVNLFRTHWFPWEQVERFVVDGGLSVRLRDTREVEVSAYAWVPGALPMAEARAARACELLERRRKAVCAAERRSRRRRKAVCAAERRSRRR